MNGNDIFHAVGNIDDKYISQFADISHFKRKPVTKKKIFLLSPKFYGSIAAAALVVGTAVYIALQYSRDTPTAPSNEFPFDNAPATSQSQTAVPSDTYDYPTYNTKNNEFSDFTPDMAEDNAVTPSDWNGFPFSIKVYAADIPTELSPDTPVQIKGDFNPLMSSSRGLGIALAVTPPDDGLTLQTDNGHFISWDNVSGAVTNHGKQYTLADTADIATGFCFWTLDPDNIPDTATVRIIHQNTDIAYITITYNETTNTFSAVLSDTAP